MCMWVFSLSAFNSKLPPPCTQLVHFSFVNSSKWLCLWNRVNGGHSRNAHGSPSNVTYRDVCGDLDSYRFCARRAKNYAYPGGSSCFLHKPKSHAHNQTRRCELAAKNEERISAIVELIFDFGFKLGYFLSKTVYAYFLFFSYSYRVAFIIIIIPNLRINSFCSMRYTGNFTFI